MVFSPKKLELIMDREMILNIYINMLHFLQLEIILISLQYTIKLNVFINILDTAISMVKIFLLELHLRISIYIQLTCE